ncbi:MAG: glycerol-3-phosphate 1-O-acyltransferase PlsY [Sphingomonadales bacterium]|nr:glycerol-3-phosphate 1-O-acyltransferase PlsY [Sphingomonadales bacterium]
MEDILESPLFALLAGYLLGSIPFGLLLTRFAGAGDIREIGSGNIGATNVLRTGRKGLAAATLLLDVAKGFVAVAWIDAISGERIEPVIGAAVGALVGHCFPVWLGFKGGKGVATMLGITFAVFWPAALGFIAVWLLLLAIIRISSVSGMAAAVSAPVVGLALMGVHRPVILLAVLAVVVIIKHHANIGRLLAGTEPRVGSPKQ